MCSPQDNPSPTMRHPLTHPGPLWLPPGPGWGGGGSASPPTVRVHFSQGTPQCSGHWTHGLGGSCQPRRSLLSQAPWQLGMTELDHVTPHPSHTCLPAQPRSKSRLSRAQGVPLPGHGSPTDIDATLHLGASLGMAGVNRRLINQNLNTSVVN